MIRTGLIGLGHIGSTYVAALPRIREVELVAGCDNNRALGSTLPRGTPFFDNHEDLLATDGFDTGVVATPNRTHSRIAMDALRAGYHVIVEKPAASSLEELDALERFAAEKGRHIYYAFHAALAFEVDALQVHMAQQDGRYVQSPRLPADFMIPISMRRAAWCRTPRAWETAGVTAA